MKKKVVIIGSGFGGSVAGLRYAEAGHEVTILERGPWVTRDTFEADTDMFWLPKRNRFGMNELRSRGKQIIPWLGAGVGGGSHVYAATIKRRVFFDDFPCGITSVEMGKWYALGEEMLDAKPYPGHAPYGTIRANKLMREAERELAIECPELVEDEGQINLAMSFAPPNKKPGEKFINKYGAEQRYSNPNEQKLLGGDIDAKNTLDKNYLFLAQEIGATILDLCEAQKINKTAEGYLIEYIRYNGNQKDEIQNIKADILIVAAGTIGSTELLMRAKKIDKTLPDLSNTLGDRYFSNGDYVSMILPFKGVIIGWLSFIGILIGIFLTNWWAIGVCAVIYFGTLLFSRQEFDPDIGATNSDFIRFKHRDGSTQGAYIEGGRYPTLLRFSISFFMSIFGFYKPSRYKYIIKATNIIQAIIPPFELLARSWPIPLLQMGRDDAVGKFYLNKEGRVEIDYPLKENANYYAYLDRLGKLIAKKLNAFWIPNLAAKWMKKIEVPHNLGGVCMGENIEKGVVDDYGRVFGYENLAVLDGSIIPVTLGPNPVGTIVALCERGVKKQIDQLEMIGEINAMEYEKTGNTK